ncbi:MAG: CsgG/HfaB family protein [Hydrococcus sp. Prado102]|jgi:curli biogenesis system outer membrane secretion channel CsgG|nr:CsgG/HfaB family protein [Hydrococcus sp. Prado102]
MTFPRQLYIIPLIALTIVPSVAVLSNERVIAQTPEVQSQPTQKIRIAVLDFDYSSISNPSWLSFLQGGARGVSDILVNRLVQSGSYSVIERSQLEAILQEQNLGASGRVDASTAAEIGRILGVQAVIIGSITQFDLERKSSGGGAFGVNVSNDETEAYVKLSARVVNTTTAEIMMVAEGNGKADQSDNSTRVFGIGGGSSTDNEGKLFTQATEQAIDQVVGSLSENSAKMTSLPNATSSITALVADVTGSTIVLNKGTSAGYQQGMRVAIERVTKEVKDPATGQVIRRLTQPVGVVEITEADSQSSVGKVVSGTQFKVGDVAKPTQQ